MPNAVLMPETTAMTSASTAYTCRRISTLADFLAEKAQWEDLHRRSGVHNFFLSHLWLATWLEHFKPEQLMVLVVEDAQGRWVAAAPLKVDRRDVGKIQKGQRRVQWIGFEPSLAEMMDVLVDPDVDSAKAMALVNQGLWQHKACWDMIDLRYCVESRPLMQLTQAFLQQGYGAEVYPTMGVPYIDLPESYEAYKKTRKKKLNLNLNNRTNRFKRDFPDKVMAFSADLPDHWPHMAREHKEYWQERDGESHFVTHDTMEAFYKTLQSNADDAFGKLYLTAMMLDDEASAYMVAITHGQTDSLTAHITSHNPAYREYNPGFILFESLISHTIDLGAKRFYFGRGEDDYKTKWTPVKVQHWNLELYPNYASFARARADYWIVAAVTRLKLDKVLKLPTIQYAPTGLSPQFGQNELLSDASFWEVPITQAETAPDSKD